MRAPVRLLVYVVPIEAVIGRKSLPGTVAKDFERQRGCNDKRRSNSERDTSSKRNQNRKNTSHIKSGSEDKRKGNSKSMRKNNVSYL